MPSTSLQLQRETEVFFSERNILGGDSIATMRPINTYKVEILAGYAMSQAAGTQDINSMESGLNPDRSSKRFNINLQPVEWNFQVYMRPTSQERTAQGAASGSSYPGCNSKPLADWFLWQHLLSNTAFCTSIRTTSAWQDYGKFDTIERASAPNVAAHTSNFGIASEAQLYIKMDNVIYQVCNVAVDSADVNGSIDGIATTTWSGKGTQMVELTGSYRDDAISVFGGILNSGVRANANVTCLATSAGYSYHPWGLVNTFQASNVVSRFIKNRLGSISIQHTTEDGAANTYVFPVTNMNLSIRNNLTYLIPEELSKLNQPIGQFAGSREITGSVTAYLRSGIANTAQLLRNIAQDTRPNFSRVANANIQIGGTTAPYVAFLLPSVQFQIPTHNIEDMISVNMEFKAQEVEANEGQGGELVMIVNYA